MNNFTVHTKSSKYHISAKERDEMLIAGEIEPIGAKDYRYIGKPRIFTSLQSLQFQPKLSPSERVRYIEGNFIVQRGDKRYYERALETANGLALRLQSQLCPSSS